MIRFQYKIEGDHSLPSMLSQWFAFYVFLTMFLKTWVHEITDPGDVVIILLPETRAGAGLVLKPYYQATKRQPPRPPERRFEISAPKLGFQPQPALTNMAM